MGLTTVTALPITSTVLAAHGRQVGTAHPVLIFYSKIPHMTWQLPHKKNPCSCSPGTGKSKNQILLIGMPRGLCPDMACFFFFYKKCATQGEKERRKRKQEERMERQGIEDGRKEKDKKERRGDGVKVKTSKGRR